MATHAGEMTSTGSVAANPQWIALNGQPIYVLDAKQSFRTPIPGNAVGHQYSKGSRSDYLRRMGRGRVRHRGLGPLGWIIAMPVLAGNWVTMADDNVEATLSSPPIITTPGNGVVWK